MNGDAARGIRRQSPPDMYPKADDWLTEWADLGPSIVGVDLLSGSTTVEYRLMKWGAVRGGGTPELTALERNAAFHQRKRWKVLLTHEIVSQMPRAWLDVIRWYYLEREHAYSAIARILKVDRRDVACRHRDLLEAADLAIESAEAVRTVT
ncbi:MAG: hypothetical protein ABF271_03000 [Abyssibacter sp.]|uniref:hypothetical protein n=1 Tax=Abyssibacter sp. TaxID=2320200 RepID=UPI00321A15AE